MSATLERVHVGIAHDIEKHGRSIICVGACSTCPPGSLPFAYTIGNWIIGLPELLVIGILRGGFLNQVSVRLIARGTAFGDGELVDLGGERPVKVIDADERAQQDYTIQAGAHFGTDDYRVQQVLIPDRDGRFPGDPECHPPFSGIPVLRRWVS